MPSSFSELKKSRSKSFEKLNKQLTEMSSGGYSNPDENKYWQPTVDSAGNGFAIIRFLPEFEGEDMPFVRLWNHGFQGPTGQWYIENCLSTIGKDDPVNEYNNKLWNSTTDDNSEERQQVRKQKRKLQYVSNIYVVKDSGNPENEGKVFLYRYGKKIFDKLNDMMNPQFEDEEPVNPFDFWYGANFRLKIRKVDGYRNYDKSEFDNPEALFDDNDKLEQIWKQQYSLQEIIDEKNFKSYDELKAKLYRVLGLSENTGGGNYGTKAEEEDEVDQELDMSSLRKEEPEPEIKSEPSNGGDDDDDDLEFFKNLADN